MLDRLPRRGCLTRVPAGTSTAHPVAGVHRYRGYYHDVETGLYYLSERYYDPVLARYLSTDSVEPSTVDPLALNLYAYCLNDPVNMFDPSGEWPAFVKSIVSWGKKALSYISGRATQLWRWGVGLYRRTVAWVQDRRSTSVASPKPSGAASSGRGGGGGGGGGGSGAGPSQSAAARAQAAAAAERQRAISAQAASEQQAAADLAATGQYRGAFHPESPIYNSPHNQVTPESAGAVAAALGPGPALIGLGVGHVVGGGACIAAGFTAAGGGVAAAPFTAGGTAPLGVGGGWVLMVTGAQIGLTGLGFIYAGYLDMKG